MIEANRCPDCVAGYVNIVESEERCPTCLGYARLKRYPYPIGPMPAWLAVTFLVAMFAVWLAFAVLMVIAMAERAS